MPMVEFLSTHMYLSYKSYLSHTHIYSHDTDLVHCVDCELHNETDLGLPFSSCVTLDKIPISQTQVLPTCKIKITVPTSYCYTEDQGK